jgi:hypothetical protein
MNSGLLNLSVVACFRRPGRKLPGADRFDTRDADQVLVAGQFGASPSITPSIPWRFSITEIVYLSIKSAPGTPEANKYLTSIIGRAFE